MVSELAFDVDEGISALFNALDELIESEELQIHVRTIDETRLLVARGSAELLVTLRARYERTDGEEKDLPEFTGGSSLIEVWSEIVYGLGDLTDKDRLAIYERFSNFPHSFGCIALSGGGIYLTLTLPTTDVTTSYLARVIAEIVTWTDMIDDVATRQWGGLEASDSGPDRDQGNTTHASY